MLCQFFSPFIGHISTMSSLLLVLVIIILSFPLELSGVRRRKHSVVAFRLKDSTFDESYELVRHHSHDSQVFKKFVARRTLRNIYNTP